MPDHHDLCATIRAYIIDLARNAASLRADEPEDAPNACLADAYDGCARDLRRILEGSLTTAHL